MKILRLSDSRLYNMTQFTSISEILLANRNHSNHSFIITFSNDKTLTIENKDKLLLESVRKDIELFLTDERTKLELK